MTSYNADVSKDNDIRPATARGTPTAWWFYMSAGKPCGAARWWVPGSTWVEFVTAAGEWKPADVRGGSNLYWEIHQDPGWELTDEASVDAWIAQLLTV